MNKVNIELMTETIKLGARIVDNVYDTVVDTSTEKGKIFFVYYLTQLLLGVCSDNEIRIKVNEIIDGLEEISKSK